MVAAASGRRQRSSGRKVCDLALEVVRLHTRDGPDRLTDCHGSFFSSNRRSVMLNIRRRFPCHELGALLMNHTAAFPYGFRRAMTGVSRAAFALLVVVALGLPSDRVDAQQLTPDQLQQLQQGRGSSNASQTGTPQEVILEPNAPANPTLPPSRLERILSSRAGVKLSQFGYDQLGVGRAVTLSQMGAVQDDYVLGPGDEIVVSLRGQENAEYRVAVNRDGYVTLPRMNPVSAGGRRFGISGRTWSMPSTAPMSRRKALSRSAACARSASWCPAKSAVPACGP